MPGAGAGGNDTLFPFFSDFKEAAVRLGLSIVETVVLASIFALALAANAGAIRLVLRRKGRPGAASCLVLNLFCADLLFISAIPVIAVVRWTESWTLGEAVCHLLFYLMSLSGSVTILSLAAVSLERVVSIVRLKPAKPWKGRLVAACLLSVWALAALATLPLSLFFSVQPLPTRGPEVYICTLVWPSIAGEIAWDVSFATVIFLIPGLVIVISYSKILQIAKASRRRLQVGMAYSERHHIRISQQDFKLFRTLFLLMISFFVMWSPIIITILLILVQKFQPDVNIASFVFFWIMAFTFSNSIVNPVLYNIVQFKHGWRQIFFCCQNPLGKKETTTDTSMKQQNGRHFTVSVITR
ncbi:free fatty acid receptor 4 isoform X2 [Pantherophis guttatus]|uniref:Free fatty acid receptor 4 isoform X2 n=1 Tax=Pantherophis guttatus TaxID=94885 RepID=A0A6P9D3X1_PANGU|nr:free fatty acid receptor 4 isoform X2 [Pantherophis guttatus]